MSEPRTCIGCKHWGFDGGERAWSDLTPGENWESHCALGVWKAEGHREDDQSFRAKLLTAVKCEKYEPVEPHDSAPDRQSGSRAPSRTSGT